MLTKRERINKAVKRFRLFVRASAGNARPAFIFGMQRSGTNMLIRSLGRHPDRECYYENDDEAFDNCVIRDADRINALVARSDLGIAGHGHAKRGEHVK